jgi:hypothetical protein
VKLAIILKGHTIVINQNSQLILEQVIMRIIIFTKHYSTNDPDNLPGSFVNITDGYFSISKVNDNVYSVNYHCKDEYGDSISGKYIGNLLYIDSSN